jgi:hypothetical protein
VGALNSKTKRLFENCPCTIKKILIFHHRSKSRISQIIVRYVYSNDTSPFLSNLETKIIGAKIRISQIIVRYVYSNDTSPFLSNLETKIIGAKIRISQIIVRFFKLK